MSDILDNTDLIRRRVADVGQDHVFDFWDRLDDDERRGLLEELDALDFDEVSRLVKVHIRGDGDHGQTLPHLEPAPYIRLPETDAERQNFARAADRGRQAIRRGDVAAFLVAGGQGTRLGYDGPKGCCPIGPVSQKTLFQLFAEKLLAARRHYEASIPWYIMTSRDNDEVTRAFFADRDFFGLPADDVFFLRQGMMPAVDSDGQLLMASPARLALGPDGHGGAIRAMKRSGALEDMTRRGVKYISHFQVDNVLVSPVDPVFLGFHVQTESQMSSRMVKKRAADERVGHFCLVDGRLRVIEYSDMPPELAEQSLSNGELAFNGGSVAIHIYDVDFVEQLNQQGYELPFHRAWKKVPFVNRRSHRIRPRQPNANKFEMFIFDALPAARKTLVLEGHRSETFSPVKNARGEDSVETAQYDMMRQAARWLRDAGVNVDVTEAGVPIYRLEISPLFALNRETLKGRAAAGDVPPITENTYFE